MKTSDLICMSHMRDATHYLILEALLSSISSINFALCLTAENTPTSKGVIRNIPRSPASYLYPFLCAILWLYNYSATPITWNVKIFFL